MSSEKPEKMGVGAGPAGVAVEGGGGRPRPLLPYLVFFVFLGVVFGISGGLFGDAFRYLLLIIAEIFILNCSNLRRLAVSCEARHDEDMRLQ